MEKSEVELAWERYRESGDRQLCIDGRIYHRVVWKDDLQLTGLEQFQQFVPMLGLSFCAMLRRCRLDVALLRLRLCSLPCAKILRRSLASFVGIALGRCVFLIIPYDVMKNLKEFEVFDELGNRLKLQGPVFLRFIGEIPEWYFKAGEYFLRHLEEELRIGDYITLVPRDAENGGA